MTMAEYQSNNMNYYQSLGQELFKESCKNSTTIFQESTTNQSRNNNAAAAADSNNASYGTYNNLQQSKKPFVWKLHVMLQDVENAGDESIVSWLPQGNAFKVHKPKEFIEKIVPFYFQQSKFKSFQRQLYFYGFTRHHHGVLKGSYSHSMFLRHDRELTMVMTPQKTKSRQARERLHDLSILLDTINNKVCNSEKKVPLNAVSSSLSSPATMTTTTTRTSCVSLDSVPSLSTRTTRTTTPSSPSDTQNSDFSPKDGDILYVFDGMPFHYVSSELEMNLLQMTMQA